MTTSGEVNVTSSIWPLLGLLVERKTCSCLNGGTCIDEHNNICQCPTGFDGARCETTELGFVSNTDNGNSNQLNSDLIAGIAVASLMVLVLVLVGFTIWRRCVRLREKRRWVKWQESRSQSKATIEGFTIVEPTPVLGRRKAGFGLHLFKNMNRKSIFALGRGGTVVDDAAASAGQQQGMEDVEAGSCGYSERNEALPAAHSDGDQAVCVTTADKTTAGHSHISVLSSHSDITLVAEPASRRPSTTAKPTTCGLETRRATVRSGCGLQRAENNKIDFTSTTAINKTPVKASRHSLPNLGNPTRPSHIPARTRRTSYAPTLNRVIHI